MSIEMFVDEIFSLANGRVLDAVDRYISNAEFCVDQMAFVWRKVQFDCADLDKANEILWDFQQQFPNVASFNFADDVQGNYVGISNLPSGEYAMELRNASAAAHCSLCLPGALSTDKYYFVASKPYASASDLALLKHSPYDPRSRPWYIAAAAGNGTGRWSAPYAFSSGLAVGSTAGRLVRARGGAALGVVLSDLEFSLLSRLLAEIRAGLVNSTRRIGAAAHALAERELHVAVLDASGVVIGVSTNDSAVLVAAGAAPRPAPWPAVIRSPSLRAGLELVNASVGGDWGAVLERGYSAYGGGGEDGGPVFATTRGYASAWGLRLVVVTVCPPLVYRGPFRDAIAGAAARAANRSGETREAIDDLRRQVQDEWVGVQATYFALSAAVVAAAAALVSRGAAAVAAALRELGTQMAAVSRLDGGAGGGPALRIPWSVARVREVAEIVEGFRRMECNLAAVRKYVPRNVAKVTRRPAARSTRATGPSPRPAPMRGPAEAFGAPLASGYG